MTVIEKTLDNKLIKTEHGAFIFVPLLKGIE